jgi:hypothetical protein
MIDSHQNRVILGLYHHIFRLLSNYIDWQAITTPAFPYFHLFNYYNVVLFKKFLTMITTSSKYIEKFLTKRLVFPGSGTLNLISLYLLASF